MVGCGSVKLTTVLMQLSQSSQSADGIKAACSVVMHISPLQQAFELSSGGEGEMGELGGGEGGIPSISNSPSGSSSASAAIKSGDGCGHNGSL